MNTGLARITGLLSLVLGFNAAEVSVSYAESMKSAVRRAVTTNPQGMALRANERAVAYELRESQSKFLPQISLYGELGADNSNRARNVVGGGSKWRASREVGVSAQLLLFDGYERANNVYRNAARLDGAIYDVLAASETLSLKAVEAYVDVVRHRQLAALAQQNIRRHKQIRRQIMARVQGGKSPASDANQIAERVFAAEAVAVEIEKALQDANAKYRRVTGKAPSGKMRIPKIRNQSRSMRQLVSASIANNYEIKSAAKVINQSQYARTASQARRRPKLFLEGNLSAGADRNGTDGSERDAYLGVKLSWNLYDGGATDARQNALAERVGQAQYKRDIKIREIHEVAERSWNSYVNGRKRSSLLSAQVNANRKIVANYREEYELSKRSLLDVLDAERARFNRAFQQISVAASYRYAGFRMLATKSRLAAHFGIQRASIARKPVMEEKFVSDPKAVFNFKIEPLE